MKVACYFCHLFILLDLSPPRLTYSCQENDLIVTPVALFFVHQKLASPEYLLGIKVGKAFPGSMGPKIQAAINFVMRLTREGAWVAISDLRDAGKIFGNEGGTLIKKFLHSNCVVWGQRKAVPGGGMKLSKDQHKSG